MRTSIGIWAFGILLLTVLVKLIATVFSGEMRSTQQSEQAANNG